MDSRSIFAIEGYNRRCHGVDLFIPVAASSKRLEHTYAEFDHHFVGVGRIIILPVGGGWRAALVISPAWRGRVRCRRGCSSGRKARLDRWPIGSRWLYPVRLTVWFEWLQVWHRVAVPREVLLVCQWRWGRIAAVSPTLVLHRRSFADLQEFRTFGASTAAALMFSAAVDALRWDFFLHRLAR